MRPRHETQWTFTSIGPSDWSEEVCPSMTINRCQTKNNMRKSCKSTLILYTEALDPMEQATKCCYCRNKHKPPYEGPMMLLGMSKCIHLIQFHPSLHPFFHPFHLHNLSTGALYKQRHRYKYSLAKEIPIFFIYITAALGLPFHKPVEIIFRSTKIPNPLVTDTLV